MEKTLSRNLIFDGKVIKLYKDEVLCPNGNKAYREVIHHHGGAGVLLVKDNEVALVKQFRYAYQEELYEIPAGKLERDENPYEAAKRELEEETGYHTESLIHLGDIYPSCGYTDEIIHIYLAKDVIKTTTHFDEDEEMDLVWLPLNEVNRMITEGKIKDAKTICALYYYSNLKN
ncbi:MAG: NUDIX hydrolase [Bacilli bacterium]|nr:NUDIX hydrolase [Bacilli bacterium]